MRKTEANSSKPIGVTVQRGLVVPPVVLQALLPDVASVVKGAMSTSSNQAQCSKVPELQQDTLKELQTARGILNPFPCNICKQRFPSREILNWHQLKHFSQCRRCRKCFDSKSQFLTHKCGVTSSKVRREDKHCQVSPYTCKTNNVNTRLQKLPSVKLSKEHIECESHCPTCKKRFLMKSDFIEHKKKTKPCKYCERCINNLDDRSHQLLCAENVKSRTRFKCKICGDQFEEKFSLTSHVRTHKTPAKSYTRKPKVATLVDMSNDTKSRRSPEDSNIETCNIDTDEINYEQFLKEAAKKELRNVNERNEKVKNDVITYETFSKEAVKKELHNVNENIRHNETHSVTIKEEIELINNLKNPDEIDNIKREHCKFQNVSPEAQRILYEGHKVRGEMVLGPMIVQNANIVYANQGAMSTSSNQAQCSKVPELQQDTLKELQTARGILNPFPCNICKQRFPSRETLNWHQLKHFSQCRRCRKCFDSKSQFLTHKCGVTSSKVRRKDKHCQVSPYTCKTNNVNTRLQKLPSVKLSKEHIECESHCPTCKKRFLMKSDFIEHKKKTKPCKYCERCINNLDDRSHQLLCAENVKSRTRFKCKTCGDQFEEKFSLTSHVRTHKTPAKSYTRKPKVATLVDMSNDTKSRRSPEDSNIETCNIDTDEINYEQFLKESVKKELRNVNERNEKVKNDDISYETFSKEAVKKELHNVNENIRHNETHSVTVKEEIELINNLKTPDEIDNIKREHCKFQNVSPEAQRILYEGHKVRGEMVLGPMIVQNANIVYVNQDDLQNKTSCKHEPTNREPIYDPLFIGPCPVKKEPSECSLENESSDRMPCKQEPADDALISDMFVGLCPIKEETNEFSLEKELLMDRKPDVYSNKVEYFVVTDQ